MVAAGAASSQGQSEIQGSVATLKMTTLLYKMLDHSCFAALWMMVDDGNAVNRQVFRGAQDDSEMVPVYRCWTMLSYLVAAVWMPSCANMKL